MGQVMVFLAHIGTRSFHCQFDVAMEQWYPYRAEQSAAIGATRRFGQNPLEQRATGLGTGRGIPFLGIGAHGG
jgi:hypothetical protein